jgi:hypothetical protein
VKPTAENESQPRSMKSQGGMKGDVGQLASNSNMEAEGISRASKRGHGEIRFESVRRNT